MRGAQYNLGLMYDDGRGVSQNIEEALKWYQKAADQNYNSALNNIGYIYERKGEILKAKKYYEQAIQQNPNNDFPHLNLAYLLENHPEVFKGSDQDRLTQMSVLREKGQKSLERWQKARGFK